MPFTVQPEADARAQRGQGLRQGHCALCATLGPPTVVSTQEAVAVR